MINHPAMVGTNQLCSTHHNNHSTEMRRHHERPSRPEAHPASHPQRDAYAEIKDLQRDLDTKVAQSALTLDPLGFLDEANIERLNTVMNAHERRDLANQLLNLAELILED